MKTFRVLKRDTAAGEMLTDADFATWIVSGWERGHMRVHPPGGDAVFIEHEDRISGYISNAPDDLKAYVRKEVCANRELAENEGRNHYGDLRTFLIEGDAIRMKDGVLTRRDQILELLASPDLLDGNRVLWTRALAFLDKHRPLAKDEIFTPSGERRKLVSLLNDETVRDNRGAGWSPYAAHTTLTGQSLLNACAFLDARLPADKVRFDCGALGTMTREREAVLIVAVGRDYRWYPDCKTEYGWRWDGYGEEVAITDPIQRQKVRDFAARETPAPTPPSNACTPIWGSCV